MRSSFIFFFFCDIVAFFHRTKIAGDYFLKHVKNMRFVEFCETRRNLEHENLRFRKKKHDDWWSLPKSFCDAWRIRTSIEVQICGDNFCELLGRSLSQNFWIGKFLDCGSCRLEIFVNNCCGHVSRFLKYEEPVLVISWAKLKRKIQIWSLNYKFELLSIKNSGILLSSETSFKILKFTAGNIQKCCF